MLHWVRSKLRRAVDPGALLQEAEQALEHGAPGHARKSCLAVLKSNPGDVHALCMLARIAADAGEIEEGLQWARRATTEHPDTAAPHYAVGRLLEAAGRYGGAEASYREAVRLDPTHARAHNNLGAVLHMQGRVDAALACYRRALELDPTQPEANQNYSAIVADSDAAAAAIRGYLLELATHPTAAVHQNLAALYARVGRYQDALASLDRALALEPERAEAHFAKAQLLLLNGDYEQGWKEYEWRWRINAFNLPMRRFAQPVWNGEPVRGTVLVHGERGLGDVLQFIRYAARLAQHCELVAVECPAPLVGLIRDVPGVAQVIAQGETLPPFAAHIPLVRFPVVFGTTIKDTGWVGPYVQADPERLQAWRALVGTDAAPRLRVGLVWAGNPSQMSGPRSTTLRALAALAQVPGITFYSLQKGAPAQEALAPPAGMDLVDLTAHIRDFSDTAALVRLLDLVIAVDTAVAHLAGAMGVPVWTLVTHSPDWRHHLNRTDNPWYPSMRLFRQPPDADWPALAADVALELARFARSPAP